MDAEKFDSNVDYDTTLDNFNGPLDLLLELVKEAKIEIREIFVSQVTEQYLEYIKAMDVFDMEKASGYLALAATLVELKSKALLPKDEDFEFEDEEDPQEAFFRKVEEYKMFKEASQKLKEIETIDIFYKEPEDTAFDVRIVYKDFNLEGLIKAFSNLLYKRDLLGKNKNEEREIPKEVFTVRDKIEFIKEMLLEEHECKFFSLFTEYSTKSELITTFQALLELLKLQYLKVEQTEAFDDITIILREDRSEDLGEIDEYN